MGDLSTTKIPCRRFKLPITFSSPEQREAVARYMETQRPHAPYLPDNLAFVARNNGLEPQDLVKTYLTGTFVAVCVGFYCGNTVCLPADPRQRMNCPKQNPSRVYTPAGTVSWGGSCMSLYPVDSPGGYQMTGRTVPSFDSFGWRKGLNPKRPWVFADWDLLQYHEVDEEEMGRILAKWEAGLYEWEWEEVLFDVAEHNELLKATKDEVATVRQRQRDANAKMMKAEQESLAKWREEKSKVGLDKGTVDKLLDGMSFPISCTCWFLTCRRPGHNPHRSASRCKCLESRSLGWRQA